MAHLMLVSEDVGVFDILNYQDFGINMGFFLRWAIICLMIYTSEDVWDEV
jgi:hypothetical protein